MLWKCHFNKSIEITLWHRCSPVTLLHIQTGKNEKYSKGGLKVYKKILANIFQLILTKIPKNTYLQGWVMYISNINKIFIKELFKVNSESFKILQVTGFLKFRCEFLMFQWKVFMKVILREIKKVKFCNSNF